jgi:hypothetical protein
MAAGFLVPVKDSKVPKLDSNNTVYQFGQIVEQRHVSGMYELQKVGKNELRAQVFQAAGFSRVSAKGDGVRLQGRNEET